MRKIKTKITLFKERRAQSVFTFHARPLYAKDIQVSPDERKESGEVAIVLQGPLLLTHHFTLETIRLYRKSFPKAHIILSTWEDESSEELAEIQKENIHIVLNKKPVYPGVVHINFQIHSTSEGIQKAKEIGMKYVLKTRTDQRMYNAQSLAYFQSILKAFPLQKTSIQQQRLVIVGMNTFIYRPYSVSDMTMYGTLADMERYWCVPFNMGKIILPPGHSMLAWSREKYAEVYFATRFLESIGHMPLFTLADSFACYRDYFCSIDKESLDLYWYKYDKEKEYRRIKYDAVYNDQELTFREWLLLYTNKNQLVSESIITQEFGKKIIR